MHFKHTCVICVWYVLRNRSKPKGMIDWFFLTILVQSNLTIFFLHIIVCMYLVPHIQMNLNVNSRPYYNSYQYSSSSSSLKKSRKYHQRWYPVLRSGRESFTINNDPNGFHLKHYNLILGGRGALSPKWCYTINHEFLIHTDTLALHISWVLLINTDTMTPHGPSSNTRASSLPCCSLLVLHTLCPAINS